MMKSSLDCPPNNDSPNCAKPRKRACRFMIASVMSVILVDPGEHTYKELGVMCSCDTANNAMRHTLEAFVTSRFFSMKTDPKRNYTHLYKMNTMS